LPRLRTIPPPRRDGIFAELSWFFHAVHVAILTAEALTNHKSIYEHYRLGSYDRRYNYHPYGRLVAGCPGARYARRYRYYGGRKQ
jgi:hypothetical protein